MRDLIRMTKEEVVLSVPFFLKWPFAIWNWAAHAHHVPLERRQRVFSMCLGGFGIIFMGTFGLLLEPDVRVFMSFFAPYAGAGFATMRAGIRLSREYRHLREIKLLEYKTGPEHPQT